MFDVRRIAPFCLSLAFAACQGPGAAPPSALIGSTSGPSSPTGGTSLGLVQEADVTTVAEGADLHISVSPDIGYDMYGREVTAEFEPMENQVRFCSTLESAEDLVQDVRESPIGTYITCPDSRERGGGYTNEDMIVPGRFVNATLLLDIIYHIPDTHTYVHFLEVAAPDSTSTNTELEFN